MHPLIVEVVLIEEAFPDSETKTAEGHALSVIGKTYAPDVSYTVVLAVNAKAVEVLIVPVHSNLNRVVQVGY